jgi:ABC-type transport system substrate-binding protein
MPKEESKYHMANLTVGTVTGDAEYIVSTFYRCDSAAPRLFNRAYFCNEEVDRLSDLSRTMGSVTQRNEVYKQIFDIVFQDAPILQLVDAIEFVPINSKLQGVYFEAAYNNWPAKYGWKLP